MSSSILVVEDSDIDFDIFSSAVADRFADIKIDRARSGERAVAELFGRIKDQRLLPSIIILDLNLIGISGLETIGALKSHSLLKHIPILVFSTSTSQKDVQRSYEAGASVYFVKPMLFTENERLLSVLFEYWMNFARLPNMQPYDHLPRSIENTNPTFTK